MLQFFRTLNDINDLAEGRHDCGRGVWKQIDENRQLLELLMEDVPELLKKKPWIIAWCTKRDEFLTKLAKITKTENRLQNFPRPWPEMKEYPSLGTNEVHIINPETALSIWTYVNRNLYTIKLEVLQEEANRIGYIFVRNADNCEDIPEKIFDMLARAVDYRVQMYLCPLNNDYDYVINSHMWDGFPQVVLRELLDGLDKMGIRLQKKYPHISFSDSSEDTRIEEDKP